MSSNFFPTRALFWSFWANLVFIFGMTGYFLMDSFCHMRPNTLSSLSSAIIYVILASAFVIDSLFQLFSIYNVSSSTHRYYAMVFSGIFDILGSNTYFIGALLTAIAFTNSNIIWTFNTVGVCGFAIGAIINMMVRGSSALYSWANNLNLLGSLLYVLALFVTLSPFTQIIVIIGDVVYLIDAVLYTICWFSDRRLGTVQGEHLLLVNK
jgi:hypothetical protein